jgi:hypothetical protein
MRPAEILVAAPSHTRNILPSLPRATEVARSDSASIELYSLMHIKRMQATNALNRQVAGMHPWEILVAAPRYTHDIFPALPRATGAT